MSKISSNFVNFLFKRDYFPTNAVNQRSTLFKQLQIRKSYHQKDLRSHFGCVNAIDFSNDGELMISGGDDRRVLLWKVQETLHHTIQPSPKSMKGQHSSNIFTLAFDSQKRVIFSGGNDDNVILHDTTTGDPLNIYLHERPVYCVSVDPGSDTVFTSACDDGRILVFDTRYPNEFELAVNSGPFHAVMYNPCDSRLVATANSKDGIALWDTRKPKEILMQYGSCESCMSIRFNKAGTQLLALRRRLPPVLYNTHNSQAVAQFDHEGYYNSCTMKSCCFAGPDDEYVVSGSDDFVLYMWRVPHNETYGQWVKSADHTLEGHRSIVNQVRYNDQNCLLASSGVEKIVKLWSPLPLEPQTEDIQMEDIATSSSRKVYTHEDYITLVLRNGETFMNHDYSLQSTNEDPRMMAFFDSLVQREIEGWSPSEDSSSDNIGSPPRRPYYSYVQATPTSTSASSDVEDALGPEAFRRSPRSTEHSPGPSAFLRNNEESEPETNRGSNNSSNSTLNTSSSSSHNHSTSSNNSMLLFLTDAALESTDTNGISERTRSILEDSLARSSLTPTTSNNKNPIKELIAQKRDRLMKLAMTTPEKRKKKQRHRFHRKPRHMSNDVTTSASTSEDEQNNEDSSNVASTSNGIRCKRKLSQTETPDSGIASDSRSNKRSTSHVRHKARSYRHLLRDSSSSSSDDDQ